MNTWWYTVAGVVLALALAEPLYRLLMRLTMMLGYWLLTTFRPQRAEYPCPVCGYDIRATPHRCPECGTPLIWGHLKK